MSIFNWGFPEQGAGEVMPEDIGTVIQDELRKSQTSAFFSPQSASPTAQTATGLGIQNVKRGFSAATTIIPGKTYSPVVLTNTWTEVYPDVMTKTVACSGRPVMFLFRGRFLYPSSGVTVRGEFEVRIDGTTKDVLQPARAQDVVAFNDRFLYSFGVGDVDAGNHRFSLWARTVIAVPSGATAPSIDGSLGYYLTVMEL